MIKRLIRAVRRKPKAVRDQYALWIAVVFTAAVLTVWYANLPDRFGSMMTPEPVEVIEQPDSIGDVLGGIREELETLNETLATATTSQQSASTSAGTDATGLTTSSTPIVTTPGAQEVRIATFTAARATTTP